MRLPNNRSMALDQLADPVLHFGFVQDADYTVVIPSSLAFHAAKEANIRSRLLPNERRFPPKNPARLREQLTTVLGARLAARRRCGTFTASSSGSWG